MLYSGNRKLGIVAVGTPDMNPLYSGSAVIDSGINIFTSASLTSDSLFSISSGFSQIELDWPKPCEYFNGTILASEFPDQFNTSDIITGSEVYSLYNDILNLNNTGILYTGNIFNNEYLFRYVTGLNISNGITGKIGVVYSRNNPSFFATEYLAIGKYTILSSTGINTITINIDNEVAYNITPSGITNAVLERDVEEGCNI